jgi:hypothetical protein
MKLYSLDVAAPEDVPIVLLSVASHYRESAAELQGAWQDRNAGAIWARFATILDRAAEQCRKQLAK